MYQFLILIYCFDYRLRKNRGSGCNCDDSSPDSNKQVMEMSEAVPGREVYDNPNYSHIMIGGQPFFILPSGELSEHVPVPVSGETLTPRTVSSQHHIYEPGSSTYRSTSDYDTDSSNFRQESDRVSDSFPPIYEEIDKYTSSGISAAAPSWPAIKSLSPRARAVVRPGPGPGPGPHSSMYYYSDTLKRRPGLDMESLQESDSGVSSR